MKAFTSFLKIIVFTLFFPLFSQDLSDDLPVKGGKKKYDNVCVSNNLTVCGNETIAGTLCAGSFNTTGGASAVTGIAGALAWGEVGAHSQLITQSVLPNQSLAFDYFTQLNGTSFTSPGSITVNETGIYLCDVMISVNLEMTITTTQISDIIFNVATQNGPIPHATVGFAGSEVLIAASTGVSTPITAITGNFVGIISLNAGDTVSLVNASSIPVYLPNLVQAAGLEEAIASKIVLVRIA